MQTVCCTLLVIAGCIIGTYTAPPTDAEVLKKFYKQVRPWGFWKPVHAQVVGLPIRHLYALTFGLGCACVAVAGCALTLLVDVTPALGPSYTLLGFVIVIVGGLGSMPGALLGGLAIGVSEALAGLFFTPSAKSMVSFGLLILVLVLRPQGLLGRRA